MNERNENNSSKARAYSLFAVALLLMGAGLFGSFYTLMGGMNTNKLAGKTECVKNAFASPIYRCPKGGKLERKSLMCTDWYEETNINKSCRSGYTNGGIKYSFNYGKNARQCNKKYPATVSCPSGYSLFKDTSNSYSCSKCTDYKETYPISCSSNRVVGKQFKCTVDGGDFRKGNASIVSGYCTKTNLTLNTIGVTCWNATYVKIQYVQGDVASTSSSYYVKEAPTSKVNQATTRPYVAPTTTTQAKLKDISLKCKTEDGKKLKNGSTVYTGTSITCETDVAGASFKATGIEKKTLNGSNKKYTFNYKKPKSSATVKVSKSGYKTKTIKFKVAQLKDLKLTCKTKDGKVLKNNSSVYTGTQIICETDVTGATFKATGIEKKTLNGSNKKYTFNYKKPKSSATVKVSKSGYKTKTIKFKVAQLKDLKLTCKQSNQTLKEGSTVTVYRPITCTVNTNGVRFKATGKKVVTLTGSKKVYDFKYTKGKDSATIAVSKDGYKTKTIKFKVTEDMKITSNSKKAFKIYCPTKVRTGDKFVCYVSEEYRGAIITTKYNNEKEVKADKNTKILYLKYDKPGTLKVSAKYGKTPYTRTVKIVDNETAAKKTKVHLNCSRTEVKSNEKFYCFSRIEGVQIKIDSKCNLNSGFNSTMTTSFANNTRKYANYFSCSKGDNTIVTVTATKDGYVSNNKTINIK